MKNYKTLNDLPDVTDVPVLVRLDLNAPVLNDVVVEDYRIRKSLPTINFLRNKGAKVVIISHIEGKTDTLKPVFERLKKDIPVTFCQDCVESGEATLAAMKSGDVVLCENLRLYDGEKKNDPEFAKKLARLGKYYVNDAFSVSHRKHASVVGVPALLPGFLGLQFEQEVEQLSKAFNPKHPFLFILGGAKFDTKLPLIDKFLNIADEVLVGGALANDLYKTMGWNVGNSLVSEAGVDLSAYANNIKITTPSDVVVMTANNERLIREATHVQDGDTIWDAGPQTIKFIKTLVAQAETILWNGPLGAYEKGFKEPTLKLAEMIAESKAFSILGGGDTVAAIQELKMEDKFGFVSTGGGAMLDFLAQETSPGLEAIKNSKAK